MAREPPWRGGCSVDTDPLPLEQRGRRRGSDWQAGWHRKIVLVP